MSVLTWKNIEVDYSIQLVGKLTEINRLVEEYVRGCSIQTKGRRTNAQPLVFRQSFLLAERYVRHRPYFHSSLR